MRKFINHSDLVFTDISSELYREYTFSNGGKLLISQPLYLNVSASGGHRVYDGNGISYYIHPAQGWYISWQAEDGKPNFVK